MLLQRILFGSIAVVVLASASVFGIAKAKPELLPPWARKYVTKPVEKPEAEEPPTSSLEANAPDDGWCEHVGKKPGKDCLPSRPTVRLASPDVAEKIGLATTRSVSRRISPKVAGNAEITYASHDYAHVTSRVAGRISAIPKDVDEGRTVKKGQVLVIMDSAEVGSAKANYLSLLPVLQLARENYERAEKLRTSQAVSKKEVLSAKADLNKADADVMKARQQLLNLGFDADQIAEIERTKETSNFLNVISPMDGTLVERHAIVGEAVAPPMSGLATGPAASLFDVTNLHHLWCWVDVNEVDVAEVVPGQKVTFTISGTTAPVFSGVVELIGFAVNPATRTVRVRAELENIDGRLRSNQFGRAVIQIGNERDAVVVPRAAVQSDAGEEFVFLPLGDGRYRTQRVQTRPTEALDQVEIAWGLKPDQEVVTTGSFELKSELLKSSLGGE